MSDLIERLRGSDGFRVVRPKATFEPPAIVANTALMREAADEIERLRAEIERLRKALTEIAQSEGEDWDVCTLGCWWTAEQALKGDEPMSDRRCRICGREQELVKLYPMPRTVTLDNGETWELVGFRSADRSTWMDLKTSEGIVQPRGGMLDTLDRIQNGDER